MNLQKQLRFTQNYSFRTYFKEQQHYGSSLGGKERDKSPAGERSGENSDGLVRKPPGL